MSRPRPRKSPLASRAELRQILIEGGQPAALNHAKPRTTAPASAFSGSVSTRAHKARGTSSLTMAGRGVDLISMRHFPDAVALDAA